jgi:YHS domain-containing protein
MQQVTRRALNMALVGLALSALVPRRLLAAEAATERVALKGYDPVGYFTDHKPVKGSAQFTASYDDVTYWFENAAHRATFVANPERYAPQYDGFCAINVARGHKYEADPEAWKIADGKLYVFLGKQGVPMFTAEKSKIVAQANANWPELRARP